MAFINLFRSVGVGASTYREDYSVAAVECSDQWTPGEEWPDSFEVVGIMISGVSLQFADAVAGAANKEAMQAGSRGRWALTMPPGFVSQLSA